MDVIDEIVKTETLNDLSKMQEYLKQIYVLEENLNEACNIIGVKHQIKIKKL